MSLCRMTNNIRQHRKQLIVGQEGEENQLIEQGQEEVHGGELFDEQEEELENLPGTDEPHDMPEGLQGVQQTDQQQQHGHGAIVGTLIPMSLLQLKALLDTTTILLIILQNYQIFVGD